MVCKKERVDMVKVFLRFYIIKSRKFLRELECKGRGMVGERDWGNIVASIFSNKNE